MRFHTRTLVCAAVVGSLACGCQHTSGSDAYPKDPLLVSKKPVEGIATPAASPVQLARAEPVAPGAPASAMAEASGPQQHEVFASRRNDITLQPATRTPGPTVATPAVRSTPLSSAPSVYGHAPDHTWLLGVLDKHYQGRFDLRYCAASEDDAWGGKVSLENDERLAQFKDGDVVRVEGELVPVEAGQRDTWSHYPRYRIRDVKLIQRN